MVLPINVLSLLQDSIQDTTLHLAYFHYSFSFLLLVHNSKKGQKIEPWRPAPSHISSFTKRTLVATKDSLLPWSSLDVLEQLCERLSDSEEKTLANLIEINWIW